MWQVIKKSHTLSSYNTKTTHLLLLTLVNSFNSFCSQKEEQRSLFSSWSRRLDSGLCNQMAAAQMKEKEHGRSP